MKKTVFVFCLLALFFKSVLAQKPEKPYSLVVHLGGGSGFFPGLIGDITTGHRIAAFGVDGQYGFSEHWGCLLGLDYQFWYFKGYFIHGGPNGIEHHPYTASGHIVRLPIRLKYHKRWFYMAFGPYLEKEFGDVSEGNNKEIATTGPTLEMGGRIRLSEKSKLQIGLQTSVGATLGIGYQQKLVFTRVEASCLFRIGYEYHL